ncbi:hypothetical protein DOY81_012196 [Sarcophaga bullata]|nr:hypothetical protein DOY81_012196 [Sarcophaga bullata]
MFKCIKIKSLYRLLLLLAVVYMNCNVSAALKEDLTEGEEKVAATLAALDGIFSTKNSYKKECSMDDMLNSRERENNSLCIVFLAGREVLKV